MGVQIEVFRTHRSCKRPTLLTTALAMFWISNQAEYFEEYIVKRKREIFPPDEKMHRRELEDFKERMRNRREQKMLKQMGMQSEE
ncbi:protein PET100 homolog, mitochondrial-like isoform X1 [Sinocyclocheilus grahami]|uniref:protein PET100 homolog, mitochondrial-like isoform X1 n=1 Tax=Sinocyclocheilus grahami TaxID=75366 RepID=UPI0007ACFDCF|nr:PREDICTED: protein PET100 homolog, mitochondrial-like isoform X1 [Sinocyclocheilus grahami]